MFSEQLKKLRVLHHLTQADLVELLKTECDYPISKASISQLENGVRYPSIEMLQNLSQIFNCSVEYLLGTEQNMPNKTDDFSRDERSRIIGEITAYINSMSTQELVEFYHKNIP